MACPTHSHFVINAPALVVDGPVLLRQPMTVIKGKAQCVQGKVGSGARPDDSIVAKDSRSRSSIPATRERPQAA